MKLESEVFECTGRNGLTCEIDDDAVLEVRIEPKSSVDFPCKALWALYLSFLPFQACLPGKSAAAAAVVVLQLEVYLSVVGA